MEKDQPKQYVPIFVGSTFEDLKSYRAAVRDALHRLETIVRGMEYFGSKPGSPIEECLNAVKSCKIYIGIFGMRYGSIPDGYEKSMTHLEYEEAQKQKLPSLIYIIDENNQPILPKYVEKGKGAERLLKLKQELKRKHMVSFYTTEDDLASKILHDLPPVLEKIGTKVDGSLQSDDIEKSKKILKKFVVLPKRWRGKEVVIEFINEDGFGSTYAELADALNIAIGASVRDYLKINNEESWYIYGENEIAEQLLELPKDVRVKARAITVFGVMKDIHYAEDGSITKVESTNGLLIKEILSVNKNV